MSEEQEESFRVFRKKNMEHIDKDTRIRTREIVFSDTLDKKKDPEHLNIKFTFPTDETPALITEKVLTITASGKLTMPDLSNQKNLDTFLPKTLKKAVKALDEELDDLDEED